MSSASLDDSARASSQNNQVCLDSIGSAASRPVKTGSSDPNAHIESTKLRAPLPLPEVPSRPRTSAQKLLETRQSTGSGLNDIDHDHAIDHFVEGGIGNFNTQNTDNYSDHSHKAHDLDTCQFPRFKDLPRDIRYMIYDMLMPGPRIVHVDIAEIKMGTVERVWDNQDIEKEGNFFDQYHIRQEYRYHRMCLGVDYGPEQIFALRASAPHIHEIFFAFQEAYGFFRRLYSQTFASNGVKATIWFSTTLDTLYLDDNIHF